MDGVADFCYMLNQIEAWNIQRNASGKVFRHVAGECVPPDITWNFKRDSSSPRASSSRHIRRALPAVLRRFDTHHEDFRQKTGVSRVISRQIEAMGALPKNNIPVVHIQDGERALRIALRVVDPKCDGSLQLRAWQGMSGDHMQHASLLLQFLQDGEGKLVSAPFDRHGA